VIPLLLTLLGTPALGGPQPLCVDAWCWEWPIGTGARLNDVVALSKKEFIAVGAGGLVLHWRKGRWQALGRLDQTLNAVRATSTRDLWVAGNGGLIAHYDGESWEIVDVGTEADLSDLWFEAGQLTAVGHKERDGVIVEGPPEGPFTVTASFDRLNALARGTEGLIAVGDDVLLLRRGEEAWEGIPEKRFGRGSGAEPMPEDDDISVNLHAAWADADGTLWAAGTEILGRHVSLLLKREERGWVPFEIAADDNARVTALGGADGEPIVLTSQGGVGDTVIYTQEGRVWTADESIVPQGMRTELTSIDGVGGAVFVVGDSGLAARRRRGEWEVLSGAMYSQDFSDMAADIAATDDGVNLILGDDGWEEAFVSPSTGMNFAVAVDPDGGLFLASHEAMSRWQGTEWTQLPVGGIRNLAAPGVDNAWAAGRNGLLRWDGEAWNKVEGMGGARAVWASATDVWTAGTGFVAHSDGQTWTRHDLDLGRNYPKSIAATGAEDAWFLAGIDTVWHWNGSALEPIAIPEELRGNRRARALGAAEGELWVVGSGGLVLRYANDEWLPMHAPGADLLFGIEIGDEDVVVYGRNAILRRNR